MPADTPPRLNAAGAPPPIRNITGAPPPWWRRWLDGLRWCPVVNITVINRAD